jgi:hypothetical protein
MVSGVRMQRAIMVVDQTLLSCVDLAVQSLHRVSPSAEILVFGVGLSISQKKKLEEAGALIRDLQLSTEDWLNHWFFFKPKSYSWVIHQPGDQVLLLDVDMLFFGDPWGCFGDFDVGFCLRNRDRKYGPFNGGLVALTASQAVNSFMDLWCSQIINPTWKEISEWKSRTKNRSELTARWSNQYFQFAAMDRRETLPWQLKIQALSPIWNWLAVKSYGKSFQELEFYRPKVVHFKANSRMSMFRIAKECLGLEVWNGK